MTTTAGWAAIWAMAVALVACGDDPDVEALNDAGSLCLSQSGSRLQVIAYPAACRTGICGRRLLAFSCDVALGTQGVTVSSRVEYRVASKGTVCPSAACDSSDPPVVPCGNVAAPAGEQTVVYGDQRATLELPLERPASLFGTIGPCQPSE